MPWFGVDFPRAVASLSLPGGQEKNFSSVFPHFPVLFLSFFLNFLTHFGLLVRQLARPGRPWLRHWISQTSMYHSMAKEAQFSCIENTLDNLPKKKAHVCAN